MQLTQTQIEDAVLRLLDGSSLSAFVSGGVFLQGQRPRDSRAEDIMVIFTDGLPGQVQNGTITLNIYVPDIDPWDNGVMVKDRLRCSEIEEAARDWAATLNASSHSHCFRFYLKQAVSSLPVTEISQHFVMVKIGYEYYDGE